MGSENDHDLSGSKKDTPLPTSLSNTLYTSERSNMDYFTLTEVWSKFMRTN
jgi:hypothetical protein